MKKTILYILILSSLVGCQDFLDVEPVEQVSIVEQLSTLEGVGQALSGAYTQTANIGAASIINYYAEVVSGNATFGPTRGTGTNAGYISVSTAIENAYEFSDDATDSDLESFYEDSYDAINNVNLILAYVDALEDATQDEIDQVKAEALSIRAFNYFNLLRVYSQNYSYTSGASHLGVIYRTEPATEETYYLSRLSCADAYAQVIADLENAIALYSNSQALPGEATSYFSKAATQSLLARVYLYTEQWEDAAATATEVITTSGIALMTTDDYVSQWEKTDEPVSETLLEFSVGTDSEGTVGTTIASLYDLPASTSSDKYLVGANGLLNLFEDTDIRGKSSMFLEEEISTYIDEDNTEDLPYYLTKKFQDNAGTTEIRLSELYLIRAEANTRLGNTQTALEDLNVIYTRAGNNALNILDSEDLLNEIFNERRRELCFERHLIFDYGRFHKDIDRSEDCLASPCELSYPSYYYILPIPNRDIVLNSNLEQNEGY